MTKKVIHLVPTLELGGLERMVLHLARATEKVGGWKVKVVAYEASGSTMDHLFLQAGIEVSNLGKGPGISPWIVSALRREIEGATVLHTHDIGALVYGAFAHLFQRTRWVHTQHTLHHLETNFRYRFYERIFGRFPDVWCVVSPDLENFYRPIFPTVRLVENGIPAVEILSSTEKMALRASLAQGCPGLNPRQKWLLCVARVADVKGQAWLARMWKVLKPEAQLVFVGPAADKSETDRLMNEIDGKSVFWVGKTLEPERWLQAGDGYISASQFEGMPLGALEACFAGLPLLLSKIPGHDLFRGDALFFDRQGGLGEAVAAWMEGSAPSPPGDRLRKAHSADAMARRYLEIYERD